MFISNLLVFIVISERQADRAKQQIQWLRAAISRCRECHTASSQETGTTGTKKAWNNMEHDGTASEWAYLIVLLVAWLLGLLGSYGHLEIRPNMSVQKSVHWMTIPHWKRSWLLSSIIRVIVLNELNYFFFVLSRRQTRSPCKHHGKPQHIHFCWMDWGFFSCQSNYHATSVYGYKQFQLLGWALPCQQAR